MKPGRGESNCEENGRSEVGSEGEKGRVGVGTMYLETDIDAPGSPWRGQSDGGPRNQCRDPGREFQNSAEVSSRWVRLYYSSLAALVAYRQQPYIEFLWDEEVFEPGTFDIRFCLYSVWHCIRFTPVQLV